MDGERYADDEGGGSLATMAAAGAEEERAWLGGKRDKGSGGLRESAYQPASGSISTPFSPQVCSALLG